MFQTCFGRSSRLAALSATAWRRGGPRLRGTIVAAASLVDPRAHRICVLGVRQLLKNLDLDLHRPDVVQLGT